MLQQTSPAPLPAGVRIPSETAIAAAVRELLDETTELVCTADADGRLTYANRAWLDALGYSLDDALGTRAVDIVVPEHRARFVDAARRLHDGHRIEHFEAVLAGRDGRRVACRGRAVAEMIDDPTAPRGRRCVGTRAVYRDVTAERAAETWRARLVGMLDASTDFVGTATPDGRIDYVNRAGRRLLGLADAADLSTLRARDFHPPETMARLEAEAFPAVLRDGAWTGDGVLRDVHGTDIPVSIAIVAAPSLVPGEPPFFTATMRDLRERLRVETELRESEARLRAMLPHAPTGVWLVDAAGTVLSTNAAFQSFVGYEEHELIGRPMAPFSPADDAVVTRDALRRLHAGERSVRVEQRFVCRSGDPRWAELTLSLAPLGDGTMGVLGVTTDITERRSAEIALLASERRYRTAIEGSLDAFIAMRSVRAPDGTLVDFEIEDVSTRAAHLLGIALGELSGARFCEVFPHARASGDFEQYAQVARTGRSLEIETVPRDPRVTARALRVQVVALDDGVALSLRDVTARVEAEAERARLLEILDATPDPVVQRTIDGSVLYVNAAGQRVLGLAAGDVVGMPGARTIYPEWARRIVAEEGIPSAIRDGVWIGELAVVTSAGEMPVSHVIIAHRSASGHVVRLSAVMRDVTARRRAEAELDRERTFLASVLDSLGENVSVFDADGRLTLFNRAAMELHGLPPNGALPPEQWRAHFDVLLPDGVTPFPEAQLPHARARAEQRPVQGVEFVVAPKGRPRRVMVANANVLRDGTGAVVGTVCVARDETTQREASAALRDNEARLSLIYNATSELMFLVAVSDGDVQAREYRCISVNEAYLQVTGLEARQVIGRTLEEVLPGDAGSRARERYDAAIATGDVQRYLEDIELPMRRLVVETTITPVHDDDGRCTHILGAARDVTERLRAERALRESEERFRVLVNQVADYAIIRVDAAGRVESWNRGAERLQGYEESEILGAHIARFYPPESQQADVPGTLLDRAARLGRAEDEGWRVRRDGSRFWAHVVLTALRDDDGRMLGYAKVTHDRTERYVAERQLAESEARSRGVLEASLDALFVLAPVKNADASRPDFEIVECNREGARFAGRSREQLLGRTASAVFRQARRRGLLDSCARVAATGEPFSTEYEVSATRESARWAWLQIVRVGDGVAVTARDISAQKASERSLRTMALVDELTGVFNRRGFMSAAERQWQRAVRERQDVLLAYIDLNDFKRINDTFGHAEGDQALTAVGEVLRATFRGADVIGRVGGDEFAVLVVPTSNTGTPGSGHAPLDADTIEAMIRERLAHHLAASNEMASAAGRAYTIALSLGVARARPSHPDDTVPNGDAPNTLTSLMADADERLYLEKRRRGKTATRSRRA